MKRLSGEACGKFILMGEHSVVYDGSAVSIPLLNKKLKVELSPEIDGVWLNGEKQEELRQKEFQALCQILKLDLPQNAGAEIVSDIPFGGGLGSSAALCCALVRACSHKKENELAKAAHEGENYFHGKSSGVDPYTVAYERPINFHSVTKTATPVSLEAFFEEELCFALIDSGARHITKDVVEAVKKAKTANRSFFEGCIDQLKKLQEEATIILQSKPLELGKLMNQAQSLLVDIGVSTEQIDEKIIQLRAAGAMGVKITGAGCGGYLVALIRKDQEPLLQKKFSRDRIIFWKKENALF